MSSVLVPQTKLHELASIASIFPLEHLADALRHALDPAEAGTRFSLGDLANLLAWAVAGLLVANQRFSWMPKAE